jgi:hypothetical protein
MQRASKILFTSLGLHKKEANEVVYWLELLKLRIILNEKNMKI